MRFITILAVAFLMLPSLGFAADKDFSTTVGGAKIIIPAPGSYVEAGDENRFFPEQAPNRLLAMFATPEDIEKSKTDADYTADRYTQVQVSKGAENHRISSSDFSKLASSVSRQQDELFNQSRQEVNDLLKRLAKDNKDAPVVELGQPKSLGTFHKTDRAVSFLMLMPVSSTSGKEKKSKNMLCGATLIRVKEKLLFAYVYSNAGQNDSTEWVKSTSKKWAESIIKANTK